MEDKWVIVYGELGEGVQGVIGPFNSEAEAEDYADIHNLGGHEKVIRKLETP